MPNEIIGLSAMKWIEVINKRAPNTYVSANTLEKNVRELDDIDNPNDQKRLELLVESLNGFVNQRIIESIMVYHEDGNDTNTKLAYKLSTNTLPENYWGNKWLAAKVKIRE
jgi:hypothetical protein